MSRNVSASASRVNTFSSLICNAGQLASIRVNTQSNREYDRDVCPFESVDSS